MKKLSEVLMPFCGLTLFPVFWMIHNNHYLFAMLPFIIAGCIIWFYNRQHLLEINEIYESRTWMEEDYFYP